MAKKIFDMRHLLFIPMIVMMILIYNFSSEGGDESSSLSLMATTEVVESIDTIVYDDTMTEEKKDDWIDELHLPVRKLAHLSEYALLSLTVFLPLLAYALRGTKYNYIIPALVVFMYACTDEFHQSFIGGRASRFTDVLIDTTGGLLMLLLINIIRNIRHKPIRKLSSLSNN